MYVMVVLRAVVGVVFLLAAVSKSGGRRSFERFREGLVGLAPAVAPVTGPVAVATVLVEWLVVVLVAWPVTAAAGFGLAAVVLTVFSAVLVGALRRGAKVPCRCFGSSAQPVSAAGLWRNGVLSAVSVAGVVAHTVVPAGPGRAGGVVLAAAAGGLTGLAVVFSDEVVDLFTDPGPAVTPRPGPRTR